MERMVRVGIWSVVLLAGGCHWILPLGSHNDAGSSDAGDARWDVRPADLDRDGPMVDSQGTTCSDSGVTFTLLDPLAPCASIQVTVQASTKYSWVIVGVTSAAGTEKWSGSVSGASCMPCTWDFPKVVVPCEPGPYRLSFMRDAEYDNPTVGVIVANCTP